MARNLTAAVKVRVEPDERDALERAAYAAGVTVSIIVRNLIREHLAELEADVDAAMDGDRG